MKTNSFSANIVFWIGALLTFPTLYFVVISVLKYGLGIAGPFDVIEPFINRWGAKESLGFNINALILFGPLIAFLINLASVISIKNIGGSESYFRYEIFLAKKLTNWVVVFLSGLLLSSLFIYALGENCR